MPCAVGSWAFCQTMANLLQAEALHSVRWAFSQTVTKLQLPSWALPSVQEHTVGSVYIFSRSLGNKPRLATLTWAPAEGKGLSAGCSLGKCPGLQGETQLFTGQAPRLATRMCTGKC